MLLAAQGRSTRSIAAEAGVRPWLVSHWRRLAEEGLKGLKDRPRGSREPIYGPATHKRILSLLDMPPPDGYVRWAGPLLVAALGDVDVQYVWRFLREHHIDLARKSWCASNDPAFAARPPMLSGSMSICRPRRWSCASARGLDPALERTQGYEAAEWTDADRPEPIQAPWHDHPVCHPRSRHGHDHSGAFETAAACHNRS